MASILDKTRAGAIYVVLLACALVSIFTTLAIIWVLAAEAGTFFGKVSPIEFYFGTRWSPKLEPTSFGVLPLIWGTVMIAAGALLIAVPTGIATAIFLGEYAPAWFRQIAKPILEVLAGVPTIVYGFFALTFITPNVLKPLFPDTEIFNAAAASIVVGIMIIPTIVSLCDDAFRAVPSTLREGGYALAATKLEVSLKIMLPAALSGVVAAVLLALARAIGETMAVTLAAGQTPRITLNAFESVETMTAYIANISLGDTPAGSIEYQTIFAVGITLFLITLVINLLAQRVLKRFREAYE